MAKPMRTRDPRIDAYIAQSAPFAQPILERLRDIVHAACPDTEETMKWSFPHFMYKGMLCGMASFKAHCTFGFWKGSLIVGDSKSDEAMGQFGCLTSLKDLPSKKVMMQYIKLAMKLNDDGIAVKKPTRSAMPRPVVIPPELEVELKKKKHMKLADAFDALSPSQRREYAEWIAEAKRPATKAARVAKTLAQVSEGKALNWKYGA